MPPRIPEAASFDWALVRSFLAVLDAGSLLGAARRTGAQQPTLGRHVAQLEAQLGAPLFERTGRGVTPTALALSIADAARQMAAGADALTQALAGRQAARGGTVRVSASQVAATWLLPPVLARLQRDEPDIQVELVASNALSNLLRREADIALRMVRPAQASLVARKLGEVPIVAAAHRDYLARQGTPRTPADLLRHRLIGYDRDDALLRGFAAQGLALGREAFALRTDDQVAYGQLLAAGAGIGFVARYCVERWPGVVPVLPQLAVPPLPCWLVVHREIRGSPAVRRVFDHLAAEVPALIGSA
ncbi:MAG: LysR family transcriptional regulator [Rubrivivax sp.]